MYENMNRLQYALHIIGWQGGVYSQVNGEIRRVFRMHDFKLDDKFCIINSSESDFIYNIHTYMVLSNICPSCVG